MGLLKKHLKARMTVYFLLVSIPVVVLLAGASYFLAAITLKDMAVARFDVIADSKEQEINRFMSDQVEIVQGVAAQAELRKAVSLLMRQLPGTASY